MTERPHVFVRGDRAFPYKAEGATLYHHGDLYAETARQRDVLLEAVKGIQDCLSARDIEGIALRAMHAIAQAEPAARE